MNMKKRIEELEKALRTLRMEAQHFLDTGVGRMFLESAIKDAVVAELSKVDFLPHEIASFKSTLMLAADDAISLRTMDVWRVMDDARSRGYLLNFCVWLLQQPLMIRTRNAVKSAMPVIPDAPAKEGGAA